MCALEVMAGWDFNTELGKALSVTTQNDNKNQCSGLSPYPAMHLECTYSYVLGPGVLRKEKKLRNKVWYS